jgi:hypothetical protein
MDHSSAEQTGERLNLKEHAHKLYFGALAVGVIGLVVAIVAGYLADNTLRRFFFAYLVSFMFFLAISLGGLFFVILQHVTKAGWSVNVRRIAEWLASSIWVMAALAAPIIISVGLHRTDLYPWAKTQAAVVSATTDTAAKGSVSATTDKPADTGEEELNPFKKVYLAPAFWIIRMVFYFAVWSGIGIWYWKQSVAQDADGDFHRTVQMQMYSPISMILFAITVTLGSFDLMMSLNPTWSSTIFGVYFFAGSTLAMFATIILSSVLLQKYGYLRESITIEHFHDLGKFLFAFTFFWGYIAFSQYMLMWYANLPEETGWYRYHGASTSLSNFPVSGWSYVVVALLLGHLLIPFGGLLSRHVKRAPVVLGFWAVWLLVFCWIDLYWIIMPDFDQVNHHVVFGIVDIAAFLGIGGIFVAVVVRRAGHAALRPIHDPRLEASLAFENI